MRCGQMCKNDREVGRALLHQRHRQPQFVSVYTQADLSVISAGRAACRVGEDDESCESQTGQSLYQGAVSGELFGRSRAGAYAETGVETSPLLASINARDRAGTTPRLQGAGESTRRLYRPVDGLFQGASSHDHR